MTMIELVGEADHNPGHGGGPHDDWPPVRSEDRTARGSFRRSDSLSRRLSRIDLDDTNSKKDSKKSGKMERSKTERRRSSGVSGSSFDRYERYKFDKLSDDWAEADRIHISTGQDELSKMVRKNGGGVTRSMDNMHPNRRQQIDRLIEEKNRAEMDKDTEWFPALIEVKSEDILRKRNGKHSVRRMYVVVAKASPRGRRTSVFGERSNIYDPIKVKGKDGDKGKTKGKDGKEKGREDDVFEERLLFNQDGIPVEAGEPKFADVKDERNRLPLEPIGGPPRRALGGPHFDKNLFDDHHGGGHHDGYAGNEVQEDRFMPHGGGGGGGGGGAGPDGVVNLEDIIGPDKRGGSQADFHPVEYYDDGLHRSPSRHHHRGRSPSRSKSKPRPVIATDQLYRSHSRRRYDDDSLDDEDPASVFFSPHSQSSATIYSDEDDFIRRGSLNRGGRRLSRGEPAYRVHRRGAPQGYRQLRYYEAENQLIMEPGRTPRRPRYDRRQTIAYPESRRITDGREFIPTSPGHTTRSYTPPPHRPDGLRYPDEIEIQEHEKDRQAQEYMRNLELREFNIGKKEQREDAKDLYRRVPRYRYY